MLPIPIVFAGFSMSKRSRKVAPPASSEVAWRSHLLIAVTTAAVSSIATYYHADGSSVSEEISVIELRQRVASLELALEQCEAAKHLLGEQHEGKRGADAVKEISGLYPLDHALYDQNITELMSNALVR
jgi:hypothetical protein